MIKNIFLLLLLISSFTLFSQDVLMQTETFTQCSGIFYDSGGAASDYSNDESFILTICPDVTGELMQLDFTSFNTELNLDIMTIYNGPDNLSPVFGEFSGDITNSPGLVTATIDNASGCLTIEFVSNGSGTATGWEATIACFEPCQTIISQLDSATPTPNIDGYIRLCPNEEIILTGSGTFSVDGTGATYEWDLGDGNTIAGQTATFSYPNPGVYIVNLNIFDTNTDSDPAGCTNNNLINQVIQVSNEPDFTGTAAAESIVCFGETTTIEGVVNAVQFINDCTPPVSGTTFLPDGSGVTYETSVTVDCYESTQTLTDINQLVSICITMEHSYLGDLSIDIISPTGQVVRMHNQGGTSANLGFPWATGPVDGNSNNTTPGVGSQYCFVPDNSFPTLVGGIQSGGTFVSGNGPGTYTDEFVPAGNYSSVNPLDGLIGSALNGDWTIRIVDNIAQDNGYIFDWAIEFDPSILPPDLSFTPIITSEAWDADATIINTTGNTITVQPPTPGIYCYTYRVTNDFGCEYSEQVCIESIPEIIHDNPNNLFVCDTGATTYEFDLTVNTSVVLAPNPSPGDLVITYHETLTEADLGTNSISNPTNYSGIDGQIIYIRIEYQSSGCYETETFELVVDDLAVANQPVDLEECDVNSNGITQFDLQSQTATILGGQLPSEFTVTYHLSQQDADDNVSTLSSPYTNISNPQTIFVRVENSVNTLCFSTATFQLFVIDLPSINPIPDYEVCDDDTDGDDTNGLVTFNLTTIDAVAINGQVDVIVSYHISQVDADSNSNALVSPYTNVSSIQEIFVRLENTLTNCYDTTTFNLIVNPLPVVTPLVELFQCDDDTDGFTEFNLTESNELISTNYLNETFTYHTSLLDAENGLNAIPNETTFLNIDPSATPDILYVRIENADGCYRTSQLNLLVSTTQILPSFQLSYEVCDDTLVDGDDVNGVAAFDFSDADAQIVSLFPPGQTLTITYYETLGDALQEINAIMDISNHRNENSPFVQTIIVRVDSDIDNACLGLGEHITLTVNPLPIIDLEDEYLLCLNTNGTEEVSLPIIDTELSNLDYSFEWSLNNTVITGFTGSSYAPTQGGEYSVLVTNNITGCQNIDSTIVNESEPPTVTAELISLAFANNHVIEATAIGNGVYEYSLDGGPWQESGIFENVSPGEHIVTARDINGCGINTAIVIVIDYPKFFTPNGDGYHDTWNIVGVENQPTAKIFIFDRYGKLLKQITPMGNGWNGTYNGKRLPTSDYWFTVEYNEPSDGTLKLFKAHFTLKR
jgi:gliding motility-associated-like protein